MKNRIRHFLTAIIRTILSVFAFAAAEQAGYVNQVYVLAGSTAMTGSTGAKIQGLDQASLNRLADILEITQFGDTHKNRMGGLKDTTVSLSGNTYVGDATGQDILIPGNIVFIGLYTNGTAVAGTQVKAIIENFDASYPIDGKQTFSVSLSGCAAPVALPVRT